nr:MAG TPA: hypothetical protein [Caudoviricetes sp.]
MEQIANLLIDIFGLRVQVSFLPPYLGRLLGASPIPISI